MEDGVIEQGIPRLGAIFIGGLDGGQGTDPS